MINPHAKWRVDATINRNYGQLLFSLIFVFSFVVKLCHQISRQTDTLPASSSQRLLNGVLCTAISQLWLLTLPSLRHRDYIFLMFLVLHFSPSIVSSKNHLDSDWLKELISLCCHLATGAGSVVSGMPDWAQILPQPHQMDTWSSRKLPFECQKIAKNYTFFQKNWQKLSFFQNKCQWQFYKKIQFLAKNV